MIGSTPTTHRPKPVRQGRRLDPHTAGGQRAHAQPELVDAVATSVLAAGLPLLARLRRLGLLLQERTLQVVVKAQRIIVPAALHDGRSDSEYTGVDRVVTVHVHHAYM